jgi:hypothetical protein
MTGLRIALAFKLLNSERPARKRATFGERTSIWFRSSALTIPPNPTNCSTYNHFNVHNYWAYGFDPSSGVHKQETEEPF